MTEKSNQKKSTSIFTECNREGERLGWFGRTNNKKKGNWSVKIADIDHLCSEQIGTLLDPQRAQVRERERGERETEREREEREREERKKKDMDIMFWLVNANGILVKSYACVYTNACCRESQTKWFSASNFFGTEITFTCLTTTSIVPIWQTHVFGRVQLPPWEHGGVQIAGRDRERRRRKACNAFANKKNFKFSPHDFIRNVTNKTGRGRGYL